MIRPNAPIGRFLDHPPCHSYVFWLTPVVSKDEIPRNPIGFHLRRRLSDLLEIRYFKVHRSWMGRLNDRTAYALRV